MAFIQIGQEEQVAHQSGHLLRLRIDALDRPLDIGTSPGPMPFGRGDDRGQWRAQLMPGIGDKGLPASLGIGGLPDRSALVVD